MVSVNNFLFFIQYNYSIPELPEDIKLFHKYIIFQPEKVGNLFKIYHYVIGGFMEGFKKIGKKIKYYRKIRGLSRKIFANRIFITESKLKSIENGELVYNFSTLNKIAKELDIDLPELLDFD